jgi:hypothetical protein
MEQINKKTDIQMKILSYGNKAKFIKKHYPNAEIITMHGKGHCEFALLEPNKMFELLNKYSIL